MLNKVDKVYHDLVNDILVNGHKKTSRTGVDTISVYGRQIRFNMKDGFPLITTKKLHLRSIIHELLWFLNGDTNIKYLNDNNVTIWDEWSNKNGDLGPVYGKQWVDWGGWYETLLSREKDENGHCVFVKKRHPGINQITNLIERLKTSPDCRRMIVSAWNVHDLPDMALMPCHYGFQVWTRELSYDERNLIYKDKFGETVEDRDSRWEINSIKTFVDDLNDANIPKREISLMWNQRSVDTGLGLPFNIASYGLLLHIIAQQVNMVPGELIGNLGDTHIYNNHIEPLKEQLSRESIECSPRLILNKAKDIFSYKFDDFTIEGYKAHPSIKMDIAV
jgi:thymidylate synthase